MNHIVNLNLNYENESIKKMDVIRPFCLWNFVVFAKEVTLGDLEVIPLPNEVSLLNDGTSFVIDESTTICYPEGNEK